MEEKKINPNLISRIQDRRGKTIFQKKILNVLDVINLLSDESELPKLKIQIKKLFSEETAYQMTSILQGTVERGTAKKLKSLKFL